MKKEEAKELAIQKTNLIIEYLEKILSDSDKVKGKMNFDSTKIDNQHMCVLDIYVPESNFERHLNLGITSDHCDILYEQLVNELLNRFLEHDTFGVSRYYSVKYGMGENFTGINAVNIYGSSIGMNFVRKGQKFDEIMSGYNNRIDEYEEKLNNNEISKKTR